MKMRVYYSDGVFRGGLYDLRTPFAMHFRSWRGTPHPHYTEYLIDTSGHGNPSTEHDWMVIQIATVRDVQGPQGDTFDDNSFAVMLTPREALRWFREHVYDPPSDLLNLAKEPAGSSFWDEETTDLPPDILPDGQKEVWDLLQGRALSAKQIAAALGSNEEAIRKRVQDIRGTGRSLPRHKNAGYFRPDAPPPELAQELRELPPGSP